MQQFIIFYLELLILSSLGINGFFAITRGRWELNPDGTKYWTGKIFKGYHFWLQRHKAEFVPYSGDEWLKIYFQIKVFFKESEIITIDTKYLLIKPLTPIRAADFLAYGLSKGFKLNLQRMEGENKENNMMIVAYKETKKYVLPEWVRDPLGECITCLSSVAGTLAFIFFTVFTYHVETIRSTEAGIIFVGMAWYFKVLLWVLFCITLAYLNEVFAHLNAKLKK